MAQKINRLYRARCQSGNPRYNPDNIILYVVAESYSEAERILNSDKNLYWHWNHGQRIAEIEEIKEPIIMKTYAENKGITPSKVDAFFNDFHDWALSKGATWPKDFKLTDNL